MATVQVFSLLFGSLAINMDREINLGKREK